MSTIQVEAPSEFTMVDPKTIKVEDRFKNLFSMNPSVRADIEASMKKDGFRPSFPIIVWRQRNCVVDGHTRLEVAISLGLEVAVSYEDFENEDEAEEFADFCQMARRNLTPAEMTHVILRFSNRRQRGGSGSNQYKLKANAEISAFAQDKPCVTQTDIADALRVSKSTVQHALTVLKLGPEDVKTQLLQGGFPSIDAAYKASIAGRAAHKTTNKPCRNEKLQAFFDNQHQQSQPQEVSIQAPEAAVPVALPEPPPRSGVILAAEAALGPDAEEDIRVYWLVKPLLDQAAQLIRDNIGHRSVDWLPPYHKMIQKLISTPEPASWVRCPACNGEKIVMGKGTCTRCSGRGYSIPKG